MPSRRLSALLQVCVLAAIILLSFDSQASAQATTPATTYKVAFFNIKSGKGQIALPGFPSSFADTGNCTDSSRPMNAWGVGLVQAALAAKVADDPSVLSLGLAEAWTCATPAAVRTALGWKAASSERNGVAIVARYGFAGPEQWVQLDTSLTDNPADTMWVLRIPVCVDTACSDSVVVFTAHWYAVTQSNWTSNEEYRIQAEQTIAFMNLVPNSRPQVLLGDLNVFSGTEVVCGQNPRNEPLVMLQDAGYVDAWKSMYGPAEGATGMWNRGGCGTPEGYVWKRIDYGWSHGMSPLSMSRFGMVEGGREAPSDHAGIVVEYPLPGRIAASVPPVVSIRTPATGATLTGTSTISVEALDEKAIARVELIIDGEVVTILANAPYDYAWSTAAVANGTHTISAAATDDDGNRTVSAVHSVTVQNAVAPGDEIVLTAADATITGSDWARVNDATAAGGTLVQSPDRSRTVAVATAAPASYVEWTFTPVAGKAYRLWIRGRAQSDGDTNDAVFAQFTGSTDANGVAVFRIGSADATSINLEDCGGCGLSGWGWQDNGYPRDVLGRVVYFTGTGPQRVRMQVQEDGLGIDQVVLSSLQYLKTAPGALKNDTTILGSTPIIVPPPPPANVAPVVTLTSPVSGTTLTAPASVTLQASATDADNAVARVDFYAGATLIGSSAAAPYSFAWNSVAAGTYSLTARAYDVAGATATSAAVTLTVQTTVTPPQTNAPIDEVVLYASKGSPIVGDWAVISDPSAAGGARMANPNRGVAKLTTAAASPVSYFELTFNADAGTPYRLWLRGRAENDDYVNDSVFVQFDHSLDASGAAIARIGTTSAEVVVIENCSGCWLSGWGWQDNAYGMGALGTTLSFSQSGAQRIRIQVREDGISLDQVVLSAVKYIATAPGATKADTTILAETGGAGTPPPPANVAATVALTTPAANASFTAPASISLVASAADSDGGVTRVDFYSGATLIGSATTSPYAATWTGVAAGSYTLTARATDTAGAVTTSAPVAVVVNAPAPVNAAPTVAITSPVNNTVVKAGTAVLVTASASDQDGTIARVEFYAGATLIGSDASGPYSVTWTPALGTVTLTARAYDNGGAVTKSAAVTIQVKKK